MRRLLLLVLTAIFVFGLAGQAAAGSETAVSGNISYASDEFWATMNVQVNARGTAEEARGYTKWTFRLSDGGTVTSFWEVKRIYRQSDNWVGLYIVQHKGDYPTPPGNAHGLLVLQDNGNGASGEPDRFAFMYGHITTAFDPDQIQQGWWNAWSATSGYSASSGNILIR